MVEIIKEMKTLDSNVLFFMGVFICIITFIIFEGLSKVFYALKLLFKK